MKGDNKMDWQQEKLTVDVFLAMLHELVDNHSKIQAVIKLRDYYKHSGGYISLADAKRVADAMQEAINQLPYNEREVKTEVVYQIPPKYQPMYSWEEKIILDGATIVVKKNDYGDVCFTVQDTHGYTIEYGVGRDLTAAKYSAWYGYARQRLVESGMSYSEACRVLDAESWAK